LDLEVYFKIERSVKIEITQRKKRMVGLLGSRKIHKGATLNKNRTQLQSELPAARNGNYGKAFMEAVDFPVFLRNARNYLG
jgi:hypothetical protein